MRYSPIALLSIPVCAAILALSGCGSASDSSGNPSSPGAPATADSTMAYVYVSFSPDYNEKGTPNEIMAYAAGANGQLTPVPGSPFDQNVQSMAVNGRYLIAGGSTDVNTYKIESNGVLTLVAQINPQSYNGAQHNAQSKGCGNGPGSLFFDRTGQSLYVNESNIDCADNQGTDSFSVDQSTGKLTYLGDTVTGYNVAFPNSFTGNDVYSYAGFGDCAYGNISSFKRSSSGLLSGFSNGITPNPTPPPKTGTSTGAGTDGYSPALGAPDPSFHVAFAELPCFANGSAPIQLATYTADASGNLTTTDTYATMPTTSITTPEDMKISPSGDLLAVAGYGGLQIFHFNGANPITSYTGVLTTDTIGQMFWDNNNHLYAITGGYVTSAYQGKLYVFTITDTGADEAPGSPYTIPNPLSLIVQPK